MSVSWDVVECNHVFFLILSIPLFEVTSAAIQQEWKQQQKIEFTFKNYSDAFHAVRVLSQTKIVFKASSNEKK